MQKAPHAVKEVFFFMLPPMLVGFEMWNVVNITYNVVNE